MGARRRTARRAAVRGRRPARRQRRAQALLGGHLPVRHRDKSAGPGWKAFRPLVPAAGEGGSAAARRPATQTLGKAGRDGGFAPFRASRPRPAAEAFYARMGKLINPAGCRPSWPTRRRWRRWSSSWRPGSARSTTARSTRAEQERGDRDARGARRSSRPWGPGRTTPPPRATCASSSP